MIPGGMIRKTVSDVDVICAMALPMSDPGSKYTRSTAVPSIDCESIRETPPTDVEIPRSLMNVTRLSMSSADRPG